jgi:pimeloyl-ACP methyl ester carboxylesterase
MGQVELCQGVIEYQDTGGDGPVLVMAHGLMMDATVWRGVAAELQDEFRCISPTLPPGAHRQPMRPHADLSLRGMGRLLAEFLERLELQQVTLCFNDWCGAQVMIDEDLCGRVGALVLSSCEAFENYPPGIPGHAAWLSAKLPGGISLMRYALGKRALRRLPMVYGWMTKRGVPDELMRDWLEPSKRPQIRRDLRKYAGAAMRGKRQMRKASGALGSFERPVLVAWASEDRIMPLEHGRRFAEVFPDARLVAIPDSYTLVPWDQPQLLAAHIRQFVRETLSQRDLS